MDWSILIRAFIGGMIGAAISGIIYDRRYQRKLAQWRREKEIEESKWRCKQNQPKPVSFDLLESVLDDTPDMGGQDGYGLHTFD